MKTKLIFLTLVLIQIVSCDILRLSRFEVVSWAPGEGYFSEPLKMSVSLDFSREPDISSVERNFSLTAGGNRVKGKFSWEGRKMTFIPLSPLEKNTDYLLNLTADAHDIKGLSMDEDFQRSFTTRPGNERPAVISCYPQMYENINDLRYEVRLVFSLPVLLQTLYENVSFNPSMPGSWNLINEGKEAVFTPAEPWMRQKQYEIRISSSLTDSNGMAYGNEFISVFTTGSDFESPYLLNASRITGDGSVFELNADRGFAGAAQMPVENDEWEKNDKLLLVFSKPVDGLSVKNALSAEDAPAVVMETPPDYSSEFIFRFDNIPVYESRFTFKIKTGIKDRAGNDSKDEYIYKIFANGKFSKPPELAGIRMSMSPNSGTELFSVSADSLLENIPLKDENYPSGESKSAWIELYFIVTEGAFIDPFSVMEHFRIDTSNNVIVFSSRKIKSADFTMKEPHTGWENYQRLEITGTLTNSIYFGLVNFIINAGLKDSLGNKNEKQQLIQVIK